MSERALPELRSRLRLDTSDVDEAGRKVDRFQSQLGKKVSPQLDTSGLDRFGSLLERNSQNLQKFGRTATRDLTLPLVAAGAASTKLSLDFDNTFQRMISLAGVSADEVDGLKESVKKLSGETGKGPQDLAEGLEVIRSAGLSGSTALDVLATSAKASAIGLGTTREVADAVTSVLNSYGSSVISATQATDILAGSVEAAKVEASEMAPQFGRLLPLASTLGVSFDQVGGALAFLTRGSGDASLASAQLGGVLQKLLNPSKQAQETLADIGLSVADLQASLRDRGLIPTLALLDEKLGGNQQKLARFFEDAQGVQGVLALLGSDRGAGASKVIDDVGDSAGRTASAFDAFSKTDTAKIKKSFAEVQVAMIDLGGEIAPLVSKLASGGADIAKVFTALPGPIQTGLLAIVALVGPVSSALGKIGSNIQRLRDIASKGGSFFKSLGSEGTGASASLITSMGPAAAAVGLLTVEIRDAVTSAKELREQAEATGESIDNVFGKKLAEFGARKSSVKFLEAGKADVADLDTIIKGGAAGLKAQQDLLANIQKTFGEKNLGQIPGASSFLGDLQDLQTAYRNAKGDQARFDANLKVLGIDTENNSSKTDENTGSLTDNAGALGDAAEEGKSLVQTLVDQLDLQTGLISARDQASDAIKAYSDNEKAAAGQSEEIEQIRADAARQAEDDSRSIASLREAEASARKDVLQAEKDEASALKDVASAIEHENDLRAKSAELLEAVNEAKEKAQRLIDNAPDNIDEAKIQERQAADAEQQARDELAGHVKGGHGPIRDDPRTTVNERQQAEDKLRLAEIAHDRATQARIDTENELNKVVADGVDKNPDVLAAQDAIVDNDKAIEDAHDGVIAANARLQESHDKVTEAEAKVGEAADATARAVEDSQRRQGEAQRKIAKIIDDAKTKAGELKLAAEKAVDDWAIAAEKAGLPLDAIKQGIAFLAGQALPDLKTAIEGFFAGLTVVPPQNTNENPDAVVSSGGGHGARSGRGQRGGFNRGDTEPFVPQPQDERAQLAGIADIIRKDPNARPFWEMLRDATERTRQDFYTGRYTTDFTPRSIGSDGVTGRGGSGAKGGATFDVDIKQDVKIIGDPSPSQIQQYRRIARQEAEDVVDKLREKVGS